MYENCGALAHLPLNDLEAGIEWIQENYNFEDTKGDKFKEYMLNDIKTYWVDGPFPPPIWNCWERSVDLTNNNQEGFNYKINHDLGTPHPSPSLLLCYIHDRCKISEMTLREAIRVESNSKLRKKYKKLAPKRLKQKIEYEETWVIP